MTLIAQATDLHVKMGPVFHVQQTSTAMEPRRTVDRIIPAKDAWTRHNAAVTHLLLSAIWKRMHVCLAITMEVR